VKPNLKLLGQKYGKDVPAIAKELASMSDERRNEIAKAVSAGATVEVAGKTLTSDELLVAGREKEGFASAEENGAVVIVSTELTPELLREGLAREIVHRIQNMRKDAGFEIADRIRTYFSGDAEIAAVMSEFGDYVRQETLSVEVVEGAAPADAHIDTGEVDGHFVTLGVVRI
jgi:isoleucyl-tRNA synthetase